MTMDIRIVRLLTILSHQSRQALGSALLEAQATLQALGDGELTAEEAELKRNVDTAVPGLSAALHQIDDGQAALGEIIGRHKRALAAAAESEAGPMGPPEAPGQDSDKKH